MLTSCTEDRFEAEILAHPLFVVKSKQFFSFLNFSMHCNICTLAFQGLVKQSRAVRPSQRRKKP
jgi:hypothetical protein